MFDSGPIGQLMTSNQNMDLFLCNIFPILAKNIEFVVKIIWELEREVGDRERGFIGFLDCDFSSLCVCINTNPRVIYVMQ